jgi:hypothetical protein
MTPLMSPDNDMSDRDVLRVKVELSIEGSNNEGIRERMNHIKKPIGTKSCRRYHGVRRYVVSLSEN